MTFAHENGPWRYVQPTRKMGGLYRLLESKH